ncbi:MAG: exonuclease SbcCD subunit D C-terminal domain-containing protein [Synergistaceae bacterium]|nr:exonuclease SbcCD subunit D C-terminal domain-containing protein [Synergistaceae bacterium]
MIKRILHTSDWHLGRRLKEHDRSQEFRQFFSWLEHIISSENIDALLVAGDIFDNTTPSVQTQDMYYSFLSTLANSSCRHIIITSGNHDSPAFLDAPSELLKLNNIHVIGQARENPSQEVLVLTDPQNNPELIVCAVPYLRDRDVRSARAEDSFEEMERSLKAGITRHYEEVFSCARGLREKFDVPIVAMGHMFLEKGRTQEDEGVRSLYVGTAVKIGSEIFPDDIAYTALGHLHSPQSIERENIRYSGSPIPMTFGEAEGPRKSVSIVELDGHNFAGIREVQIPVFQKLNRVQGSMQEINTRLGLLCGTDESIWLEVTLTGNQYTPNFQDNVNDCVKDFPLIEVLSLRNESTVRHESPDTDTLTNLGDIEPMKMFERRMDKEGIEEEKRYDYRNMYIEILRKAEREGVH